MAMMTNQFSAPWGRMNTSMPPNLLEVMCVKKNPFPHNSESRALMCAPLPIPVVASCGGWRGATVATFEVPTNSRGRSPHQNLLPLPAPQRLPPRCPTSVPRVNQPGAIPQHSNKVLNKPPSSTGPAKALPRVIQEERTTPGEKQTQSNTWTSPAWVPMAMSTIPRSHLCVNLPLSHTHLPYTALSKMNYVHCEGPGCGAQSPASILEQPNPLPLDLGAPSAPGIFTLHSPPPHPVHLTCNDFPSSPQ